MKFALINPNWKFDGSVYFGCKSPHLPLEFGLAQAYLQQSDHEAIIIDGRLHDLSTHEISRRLRTFRPDFTVITTAPTYLFWRCPPPELREPQILAREINDLAGAVVIVGPHGSVTPKAAMRKLAAQYVIVGECETVLPRLAEYDGLDTAIFDGSPKQLRPEIVDLSKAPELKWSDEFVKVHDHHHHRFDSQPAGLGAEIESSRGCPFDCLFCAKQNFRGCYRKRPTRAVLKEMDHLISRGVSYFYFIDEIFRPDIQLLEQISDRKIKFGIQTRIDQWSREFLELLGQAGCISIEAGVESVSESGRRFLQKKCGLTTDKIAERLIHAKRFVPFVQANLIRTEHDDPIAVQEWRSRLIQAGVWANDPVPMYPYPGSPAYESIFGACDDFAWEKSYAHYRENNQTLSELQDSRPAPLEELEISTESPHYERSQSCVC